MLNALLSNAVQFTEEGKGGEIVLRLWVENASGEELACYRDTEAFLCFSVSDTGCGISQESLASVRPIQFLFF